MHLYKFENKIMINRSFVYGNGFPQGIFLLETNRVHTIGNICKGTEIFQLHDSIMWKLI